MSTTALKGLHHRCFPVNIVCEYNFFWFILLKHPFGYVLQSQSSQKFWKAYRKTPVLEFFLLDKIVNNQACNFIKKRLQRRCFTVNLAELLKAPSRTPPVSAFDFNATFLTLRPRKTYIYVFSALLFLIFLSHFLLLIEARNKSIWFNIKFWLKQALFLTF